MKTNKFLVSVPFTGLGLYGGFRGNRWLRNRIKIFEQFVIPSLLNQTDRDFIVWVAWRREEQSNPYVQALYERLQAIPNFKVVFTYSGVPFWDDKYEDEEAHDRLYRALKEASPALMEAVGDCDEIYWLLQPSDDCYQRFVIESVKKGFAETDNQALSFKAGYISDYTTLGVKYYTPEEGHNPPFFAIRFDRAIFFDPGKHINYTGPYKSHEYIGDKLKLGYFEGRGFLVGCHGENISTYYNNPYAGEVTTINFSDFGLGNVRPLELPISIRKRIMRRLPYRAQRKLRYVFGEKGWNIIYQWLRN